MPREIKYRAWDTLHKIMSPNCSIGEWIYLQPRWHIVSNSNPYESTAIVFMQFTGLLDKNGKEIYEGDIISTKTSLKKVIGTIEFYNSGFNLFFNKKNIIIPAIEKEVKRIEVIGNIYENHDLLK